MAAGPLKLVDHQISDSILSLSYLTFLFSWIAAYYWLFPDHAWIACSKIKSFDLKFDHFQVVLEAGTDRSLDVGNNKVFASGSLSWSLCLRLRNILKRGLTDSNGSNSNSNNSKF